MKRLVLTALLALLGAPLCFAVEIQQGQQYPGGTLLEYKRAGIALRVPEGWRGAWPAQSSMLVLVSPAQAGYVFVYVDEMNQSTATTLMSDRIDLGDGVTLLPKAPPKPTGPGMISGDYQVAGTPQELSGRVYTRIGEFGIGAAFLTVAGPADFDRIAAAALQVARGTQFNQPKIVTAGAGSWQEYMRGRYVVRYYTTSGYTEEDHIWLCSDGTFHRSNASGGFGGGASGAFSGQASGRWQALGETQTLGHLVLQYGPGGVSHSATSWGEWTELSAGYDRIEFSLRLTNDKLYLNDRQWFRDTNQYCP